MAGDSFLCKMIRERQINLMRGAGEAVFASRRDQVSQVKRTWGMPMIPVFIVRDMDGNGRENEDRPGTFQPVRNAAPAPTRKPVRHGAGQVR